MKNNFLYPNILSTRTTNIVTYVYAERRKLVVETLFDCHRLLDRAEVVKNFIGDSNNSVHLTMKASEKVVEILIDLLYSKVGDNQRKFRQLIF